MFDTGNSEATQYEIDPVTPDTVINWDASGADTDSRIHVHLLNTNENSDGSIESISEIQCYVDDIGTYEFPADVQEQMDPTYQQRGLVRVKERVETVGDVLIAVKSFGLFLNLDFE